MHGERERQVDARAPTSANVSPNQSARPLVSVKCPLVNVTCPPCAHLVEGGPDLVARLVDDHGDGDAR